MGVTCRINKFANRIKPEREKEMKKEFSPDTTVAKTYNGLT